MGRQERGEIIVGVARPLLKITDAQVALRSSMMWHNKNRKVMRRKPKLNEQSKKHKKGGKIIVDGGKPLPKIANAQVAPRPNMML